jgi:polyisoprenoid-binding protein YceI
MTRSLLVLAAAALLIVGCNNSSPMAPPPPDKTLPADLVLVGPGGVVKLTGENTKVTFVGTKPNGKHEGGFHKLSGEIHMKTMSPGQLVPPEERTLIARLEVEIDSDSLYTDQPGLTTHLKGGDFFKVQQHPKITFASTKVRTADKAEDMTITGDLTVVGVKKEISFPVKASNERGSFHLAGTFKVNRQEIGITFKPKQGSIDDEVTVSVEVGVDPAAKK